MGRIYLPKDLWGRFQITESEVLAGKRTLVAAHGNSLRALIMAMEGLTGEAIIARELATGVPIVYRLNADSTIASREELS